MEVSVWYNPYAIANNCYFYDQKHDKLIKLSRNHAFKLSQSLSHSFFLQSCLNLGLTPNNLTLNIPISASPPELHHTLATLRYIQSIHLTHTVLRHHMRAFQTHATKLKHLVSIISQQHPTSFPQPTARYSSRNGH